LDRLASNVERERAFAAHCGPDRIVRLPWRAEEAVEPDLAAALAGLPGGTDGLLCGNGAIGLAAARLRGVAEAWALPLVSFDDLPGADALALDVYAQPVEELAHAAWSCLVEQARRPARWKARTVRLQGALVRRGATTVQLTGAT
jgi:DNA-binding LacI/PurR family transcriptional regulator